MRVLIITLGVLLCGLSRPMWAAEIGNLYETDVIAQSLRPQDRDQAIRKALAKILRRILVTPDPMADPVARTAMENALFYAKSFQFALGEIDGQPDTARRLRVVFDDARLLDLLRSSQTSLWNEMRPETLVWLVIEDEQGMRRFFSPGLDGLVGQALNEASEAQGLPLNFPLLDLRERENLAPNDVLSAYPEQVLAASKRYEALSILVGRLVRQDGCWYSEWSHYFDRQVRQWLLDCQSLEQNLDLGLHGVFLRLGEFYGVKPDINPPGSMVISLSGIQGIGDVSHAMTLLQHIPGINAVSWLSVTADLHRYRLDYQGDAFTLKQALERSGHFQALPAAGGDTLRYRLLRP
ncbi:MAG: DUF2066 domain-containing protein [Methylococcales bacterium]|nr:DUF2066 domain-containing protein [Methylococcales bacterium]